MASHCPQASDRSATQLDQGHLASIQQYVAWPPGATQRRSASSQPAAAHHSLVSSTQATHRINIHHGAALGCRSWRPCPVSELSSAAQPAGPQLARCQAALGVGKHRRSSSQPVLPLSAAGCGERPARCSPSWPHVTVSVSVARRRACLPGGAATPGRPGGARWSPAERMSHNRDLLHTHEKQPAAAALGPPLPTGAAPALRGAGQGARRRRGGGGGVVEWRKVEREAGGAGGPQCNLRGARGRLPGAPGLGGAGLRGDLAGQQVYLSTFTEASWS